MGITNGVATIPGFVSPSVVGALINGNVSSVVLNIDFRYIILTINFLNQILSPPLRACWQ